MPSTLLTLSSSIGINDTPFVDTWHGKPGVALPSQQSSAGNGTSGLIAGFLSRPYIARSISACSCYVPPHRRTPCRFGVIPNHLRPQLTNPLTQNYSHIPSRIMVCHYHDGGKHRIKLVAVTVRVREFTPRSKGWRGANVHASLFLGCTVCCGSIGTIHWDWEVNVFTLPPTPHSCHSYSTSVLLLC
jgi:hypothetical protein